MIPRPATASSRDLRELSLRGVPMVLMYHAIDNVAEDPYDICVSPERFTEQMAWLAGQGLRGVSMGELVDAMRADGARGLVGLTFDDGYVNVLHNVLPVLTRHGFTATTFIVAGLMGKTNEWDAGTDWPLMTTEQVLQVKSAGMEIGSHTMTHIRLRDVPADQLAVEVRGSRSDLTDLLGHPVRGFAYPWGSMDAPARQAVVDAGYGYACAVETPVGDLGVMALPRIVFTQRDGTSRMVLKKYFFRSYSAVRGTRRHMSYSPFLQAAKERLTR